MLGEAGGGGGKQAHLTLQGTEIEEGREDENSWPGISWERCKEAGDVNRHRARLLAPRGICIHSTQNRATIEPGSLPLLTLGGSNEPTARTFSMKTFFKLISQSPSAQAVFLMGVKRTMTVLLSWSQTLA